MVIEGDTRSLDYSSYIYIYIFIYLSICMYACIYIYMKIGFRVSG